jgi:hypothetical protein
LCFKRGIGFEEFDIFERGRGNILVSQVIYPVTDKSGKKILSIRGTEKESPEDYGDDVTLYNAQVPEQFNSLSIKPTFFSPQKKVTKKALQTVKELTGCKYLKSFSNLSKTQKLISFKQFDFINDKFQKDFNSLKFGSYSQGIVSYGCENNIISFKKAA